jgi:hypothetical protein
MDTAEDCFPRIEAVRDSLGNFFRLGIPKSLVAIRPNDTVQFIVTASDPFGAALKYGMTFSGAHSVTTWQDSNEFSWTATKVAAEYSVYFWIKSPREHYANDGYHHILHTAWDVLSPKSTA